MVLSNFSIFNYSLASSTFTFFSTSRLPSRGLPTGCSLGASTIDWTSVAMIDFDISIIERPTATANVGKDWSIRVVGETRLTGCYSWCPFSLSKTLAEAQIEKIEDACCLRPQVASIGVGLLLSLPLRAGNPYFEMTGKSETCLVDRLGLLGKAVGIS